MLVEDLLAVRLTKAQIFKDAFTHYCNISNLMKERHEEEFINYAKQFTDPVVN